MISCSRKTALSWGFGIIILLIPIVILSLTLNSKPDFLQEEKGLRIFFYSFMGMLFFTGLGFLSYRSRFSFDIKNNIIESYKSLFLIRKRNIFKPTDFGYIEVNHTALYSGSDSNGKSRRVYKLYLWNSAQTRVTMVNYYNTENEAFEMLNRFRELMPFLIESKILSQH